MTVALSVVVALQTAALIALGVVLIVSRKSLAKTRSALARERRRDEEPRQRRKTRGVAPLAVKTVLTTVQTADAILRRGIGEQVRSSIEDLAGWARVEKPDLKRIVSEDGRVVLVFSDIEGSTERNAALGDGEWVKVLERHNAVVTKYVTRHKGFVVKNQGDGFMLAFSEPVDAVLCCMDIQRALREDPLGVRVRMGAHVGTSVRRGADLFGLDVAMASRVADTADGGEIVVSEPVWEALRDVDGMVFDAPRQVELKGLAEKQTVYAVGI